MLNYTVVVLFIITLLSVVRVEPSALSQLNDSLNQNQIKNIDNLKYSSLVYGLLASTSEKDVSKTCFEHGQRIIQGIIMKETWAMKVLDASGSPEFGFILGNNHWLGSKVTCDLVDKPFKITMSNRYKRNTVKDLLDTKSPISVDHKMVYAKHASPWQIDMLVMEEHVLHIGLCLPTECSNSDVYNMMRVYFQNNIEVPQFSALDIKPHVMQVKNMRLRDGFYKKKSVLCFALVIVLSIGFSFVAYLIDKSEQTTAESSSKVSTFKKLILYFSPKRNLAWLYDTTKPTQSIDILFGMKSLACFPILAVHTQCHGFFSVKNTYQMYYYSELIANQWIANAPVLVDVFFVISGFLMSKNFLRNKKQMEDIKIDGFWKNGKLFGKMVLQRYLRLAPMYFVVMLATEIFSSHIVDTSYFYMQEKYDVNCQRHWWRNVLFIQNLFDFNELCVGWTWSLACEMQFFVLFLALLFIYAKNNSLGMILFFTLAGTMFIHLFYVTLQLNFVSTFDVLFATGQAMYYNSMARMSPYFPGVVGGWIYTMYKGKTQWSMKTLRFTAMCSAFIILVTMNSTINREGFKNVWMQTAFFVVGRWVYPTSIMAFILVNTFGYQNTVTRLFSAKIFVHISKLEYAIYLLNPLVVIVLSGFSNSSQVSDPVMVLNLILAVTAITYVLAVFLTIFFELPLSKVIKDFFGKRKTD